MQSQNDLNKYFKEFATSYMQLRNPYYDRLVQYYNFERLELARWEDDGGAVKQVDNNGNN